MKLFECDYCDNPVFFENTVCESCRNRLGYHAGENRMFALAAADTDCWELLTRPGERYRICANHEHGACNWIVPADGPQYCAACNLNGAIPFLGDEQNLAAWRKIELAKHRMVYALLRLALPIMSKQQDPESGLEFRFLSDSDDPDAAPVMTGHQGGVITINIKEADSVHRTKSQEEMREPYRTLIGHFRHETGHYYWDRLIRNEPDRLDRFRELFGDERIDYDESLRQYYANGPDPEWPHKAISAYASSHPWEDWAETWAHYLHIMGSMETAHSFGISVQPKVSKAHLFDHETNIDPYGTDDFKRIVSACLPLFYAINSMNRSMGQADIYPFVLTSSVVEKMCFIHGVVRETKPGTPIGIPTYP